MTLISLAKNPVPSGAYAGFFKSFDGVKIRFARWMETRGPRRGTVCIMPGRCEPIEKYFEVVADLRRRGFCVAIMDLRGQGGSDRLLDDPLRGHVRAFADYDHDLTQFMKEVVLPDCPPPYYGLGHSLGGHIMLRNAHEAGSWFQRIIASAPMIAIASEQTRGHAAWAIRAFTEVACLLGQSGRYPIGGKGKPLEILPFDGNSQTQDRERFERNRAIIEAAPHLALGSPSIGWLRAAYRSMAQMQKPDYPIEMQVPSLIFAAGLDTIVSTPVTEEFALRLKVGSHVLIGQSRHEILQETDTIRLRFWAAFDAYLGVDASAAA
jgi:lysophospholipase